jgi:hypothetical protein
VGHDEIKQGESRKRVARWERGQGRGREGTGRDATGGGGRGTACGPEFDILTRAEIGGKTEVDGCGWRWGVRISARNWWRLTVF